MNEEKIFDLMDFIPDFMVEEMKKQIKIKLMGETVECNMKRCNHSAEYHNGWKACFLTF